MRFPIEWLKKYVEGFPKDYDELTDKLSMTGFMLEKPIEEVEGMHVADLEFRRNRADCEGMVGMAREVVAAFGGKLKMPKLAELEDLETPRECELKVEAEDLVERFYLLHLRVKVGETPKWMMKRLKAYGEEPSGNILIDTTNYVMIELSQPLHAFDLGVLRKIEEEDGGERPVLNLRRAKKGEKLTVIGGKEVELDERDLLISGSQRPLALAGVMGGEESAIGDETEEIILEAAVYDRVSVRLTSRRLDLRTEAADRLQKDRDPALVQTALARAVHLLQKYADAEIVGGRDYYPAPTKAKTIEFDPKEVERYGGVEIAEFEMSVILESLGFEVVKEREAGKPWKVTIPTFRPDCQQGVDLIEEILRIWGYEKIPAINMETPIPDPIHWPTLELEERIRDLLAAMGVDELYTIAATTLERLHDVYTQKDPKDLEDVVKIETPPTKTYQYMRTNMFATFLDNVEAKLSAAKDRVAVFEVGRVYFEDSAVKDDVPYREPRRIAGVVSGNVDQPHWDLPSGRVPRKYTWYDAKGIVAEVLEELGVEYAWADGEHGSFEEGTVVEVLAEVKGKKEAQTVAWVGEIAESVREKWGIKQPLYAFEIDIDLLAKTMQKSKNLSKWSEYPKVLRDISVVVDEQVESAKLEDVITEVGGEILYDVSVSDVYAGGKIGKGKKNLVYSLTYWSKKGTLTAAEVEKVHKKIGNALIKKVSAKIAGWGQSQTRSDSASLPPTLLVGKVIKVEKHPNADKLHVVTVDLGAKYPGYKSGQKKIVCGAGNIKSGVEGKLVPVALPGAKLMMAKDKERAKFEEAEVKEVTIRGVRSYGMLCSSKELGNCAEDGILILDQKSHTIGSEL